MRRVRGRGCGSGRTGRRVALLGGILLAGLMPARTAAQAERIIPPGMEGMYDGFHYAPAVRAGDFLYLSGVVGAPRSQGEAGLRDAAEQVFNTAAVILAEAGYTFDDVVEMTSFHTDLQAQKETFQEVRDRYLAEPWPAWTALDIDGLWMPEAVVEVRFTAWRQGAGAAESGGPLPPGTHAGPLAPVERRLAEGPYTLPFHVTASGAIQVDLTGEVAVEADGTTRLVVQGDFAGQALDHAVVSDGSTLTVRTPDGEQTAPAPPYLADALTVGLVRMGVLHNISRLATGRLPDHASGGVRGWVRLKDLPEGASAPGGAGSDEGALPPAAIRVLNVPSGAATLVVDDAGMPTVRYQRVDFPGGAMVVEERYGEAARGG